MDFVVLDTKPIASGPNHVPIILGRPFLATANAIINCRNGVMQLTFGNMTFELNIFHLSNKHKLVEDDKQGADDILNRIQNSTFWALIKSAQLLKMQGNQKPPNCKQN